MGGGVSMKYCLLKKSISVAFVILILIVSVFSVFAVTDTATGKSFELGAILVELKQGSPSVKTLLAGFDIVEIRLITPGSTSSNVYHVKFAEKSEDIVWRAIETLKVNSYVKTVEPNYYGQYQPIVPIPPVESPTDQIVNTNIGDADGDGVLSIVDATCIQRYLAGLLDECDINLTNAKVAGNEKVTIIDATMVQRKLVGLVIS